MDTLNGIVTILGNGFFPIAVCGFLFWYVWNKDKQHKEEISELRKSIDKIGKALDRNTEALERVVDLYDSRANK